MLWLDLLEGLSSRKHSKDIQLLHACFMSPETTLETLEIRLYEAKEILRLKNKSSFWLPGRELLLSSLYSIHQFPVVSKAEINYPAPFWSIGMRSLWQLCGVDTAPCFTAGKYKDRDIPCHCRLLPAEWVQMHLVIQSLLQKPHLAEKAHPGHSKKVAFLSAAHLQPHSKTNR